MRRHNDQDYHKLYGLINDSIDEYKASGLNRKLWNRFWETIDMYNANASYQEVLQTLFGAKCQANIKNHKNIKNMNTNLK